MINRDVGRATAERFDFLVVGGGIYGVFLAMEGARRGLRPLLIERDDFGGATSWNSLRILHGGLRYLQSLDLRRFGESVAERRWFCQTYPDLVEPLECLMPLYGTGLKRPSTFRAALALNDLLARERNAEVQADRHLPAGRVLDAADTASLFPQVDRDGLKGGGLWHDAVMTSSTRVLVETLRWACHNAATALNYVECIGLLRDGDRVTGVAALDRLSGDVVELIAPVVVNCTGPWSRALAARLDRDHERLFRPSLAFNLLLDRDPLSEAALAVTPPHRGARTYFLRPWRNRIFAGTFHASCDQYPASSAPTENQIERFLADLNRAVPALELTLESVVRVYSGLLPARRPGTEQLSAREVILDHGATGGPSGLWSVSGVKYTTSRLVAERTLRKIFGRSGRSLDVRSGSDRPPPREGVSWGDPPALQAQGRDATAATLRTLVEEEAVVCLDDLVLRRADWAMDPKRHHEVASSVTKLLGWQLPLQVAAPRTAAVGSDA